ncbi:serine/threonine-protein kinase [Aeromicrobium sp.]|uniref:serine/threonine-protein kinase n=1 Tax=Aeromicrobium sp. TaxID=1871063 RepID=UPI002FC84C6C
MSDSWGLAGGDLIAPGLTAVKAIGGGTGYEAWIAFDERLHAPVVVKVVRPSQVDDEGAHGGLIREIEMLQRLNHPGIVRMFAYDVEYVRPHLVLENIDGPNLSSLIASEGHLQLHQLLPLALELSSALHYLSEEGVCHLDIKPSNIIMGAPAKLIDLSLAIPSKDAADLVHPLGTDEYMPPEQCKPGELGQVGHASDMWSFGATMFRAAAGYRAWERDPRWRQLTDDPYPLPEFVPAPLADLIRDCLAHDPASRPLPHEVAARLEPMMELLPKARLSGFSIKL